MAKTLEGNPRSKIAIRANLGGSRYKDKAGIIWEADRTYAHGAWGRIGSADTDEGSTSDKIAGTKDQPLFQTIRVGEKMAYRFDVPNGSYAVRLLFCEIYWESSDAEDQAVYIQGEEVLSRFNIFNEAGHDCALEKVFKTKVSDGKLEIRFEGQSLPMHSGARACGIEVMPLEISKRMGKPAPAPKTTDRSSHRVASKRKAR